MLAAVQERSEGNPLFVSQVARLLADRAGAVEEVAEAAVPAGIRQAIRRQVDTIAGPGAGHGPGPGPARRVLTTAAVLGTDIDPGLVAAALAVPAGSVSEVITRAERAGLLRPGPGPAASYRFARALIREALYAELTPLGRAESHEKLAAVLSTAPWRGRATHALLAHHFLRAVPAGRAEAAAKAVGFAALAGQDALDALAYEEAAGHFENALGALPER
jgi:predicted ATPase